MHRKTESKISDKHEEGKEGLKMRRCNKTEMRHLNLPYEQILMGTLDRGNHFQSTKRGKSKILEARD